MKNKIFIFLFLVIYNCIYAQSYNIEDSLRAVINQKKGDTTEVNAIVRLGNRLTQLDSVISLAEQGLLLARKLKYKKGEADCFFIIAMKSKDFSEAIRYCFSALNIYKELHNNLGIASVHLNLQGAYRGAGDYGNALIYAFSGEYLAERNNIKGELIFTGHRLAPLFLAEIAKTPLNQGYFSLYAF